MATMSQRIEDVRDVIFACIHEQKDIPVINNSEIEPIRPYRGSWRSEIHLAHMKRSSSDASEMVAVKVMNKRTVEQALKDEEKSSRLCMYLAREVGIWRKTGSHPNIAQVYGILPEYRGSMLPAIIIPYYPDGNLRELVKGTEDISLCTRLRLLRDVAKALECIHSLSPCIVHRDIRASNVLIKKERNTMVACLSDFGSAKFLDPRGFDAAYTTTMSTLDWLPPEYIIDGEPCYKKATPYGDIWSFGCTVLETMTAENPWKRDDDALVRLSDNRHPPIPQNVLIPPTVASLLRRSWSMPPDSRLTAPAIARYLDMIINQTIE